MTLEGIISAMHETINHCKEKTDIWREEGLENAGHGDSVIHMIDLVNRASMPDFSIGKANRWLGFMQGVAVARRLLTVEEAKEINKKYAEPE